MVHGLQISIAKGSITTEDGLNSQGPFFTAQIDRKSSLASCFLELFGFLLDSGRKQAMACSTG